MKLVVDIVASSQNRNIPSSCNYFLYDTEEEPYDNTCVKLVQEAVAVDHQNFDLHSIC